MARNLSILLERKLGSRMMYISKNHCIVHYFTKYNYIHKHTYKTHIIIYKKSTDTIVKLTTNQNSLFRSRDWLSANQFIYNYKQTNKYTNKQTNKHTNKQTHKTYAVALEINVTFPNHILSTFRLMVDVGATQQSRDWLLANQGPVFSDSKTHRSILLERKLGSRMMYISTDTIVKLTTNQNSLFRSRDWLSANQFIYNYKQTNKYTNKQTNKHTNKQTHKTYAVALEINVTFPNHILSTFRLMVDVGATQQSRDWLLANQGPVFSDSKTHRVIIYMTSKQPIRTRYLGHVNGYQPIRDQYFLKLTRDLGHVTSYQPIRDQYFLKLTRDLGHVTSYQPIRDQYFLIRLITIARQQINSDFFILTLIEKRYCYVMLKSQRYSNIQQTPKIFRMKVSNSTAAVQSLTMNVRFRMKQVNNQSELVIYGSRDWLSAN
eukprot:sb/3464870/